MNSEVPLLVISCDKYSDLWEPFFCVFRTHWPDCPFDLYLGTNHLTCNVPGVKTINVGDDRSWADGLCAMLEKLNSTHVILFLEDFFLTKPVQTSAILRLVEISQKNLVDCLRFAPLPPPTPLPTRLIFGYKDIAIVEKDTPYFIATQPAIWRKDFLSKILVPGFSAWEFEHTASTMAEFMDAQVWGPLKPYLVYEQGVEKGKWKPSVLEICHNLGAEVDLNSRSVFGAAELDAHLNLSSTASRAHNWKIAAIQEYQMGHRIKGTKNILSFISIQPFSIQGWLILVSGLLGANVLQLLRKTHLKYKIYNIRRRSVAI